MIVVGVALLSCLLLHFVAQRWQYAVYSGDQGIKAIQVDSLRHGHRAIASSWDETAMRPPFAYEGEGASIRSI